MQLRRLVFPAPLGPMTAWSAPRRTSKLTSESAVTPRKWRIRLETRRSGMGPSRSQMTAPVFKPHRGMQFCGANLTGTALSGRPEHRAPAQAVHVDVEDELPALAVHVHHAAPPGLGHPALPGDAGGHPGEL